MINRRTFLKIGITGLVATLVAPTLPGLPSAHDTRRSYIVPMDHMARNPCHEEVSFGNNLDEARTFAERSNSGVIFREYGFTSHRVVAQGWVVKPTGDAAGYYKNYGVKA